MKTENNKSKEEVGNYLDDNEKEQKKIWEKKEGTICVITVVIKKREFKKEGNKTKRKSMII